MNTDIGMSEKRQSLQALKLCGFIIFAISQIYLCLYWVCTVTYIPIEWTQELIQFLYGSDTVLLIILFLPLAGCITMYVKRQIVGRVLMTFTLIGAAANALLGTAFLVMVAAGGNPEGIAYGIAYIMYIAFGLCAVPYAFLSLLLIILHIIAFFRAKANRA